MGTSREIIRYKKEQGGRIIEVVIRHLSEPLPGSAHPYKYRLFCGQSDGSCIVRYDNERGKGDHRHVAEKEEPYSFFTLCKLIKDFESDVVRV